MAEQAEARGAGPAGEAPRPGGESLMLGELVRQYRDEELGAGSPSPAVGEIAERSTPRLRAIASAAIRRAGLRGWGAEELMQELWAGRLQTALAPGRPLIRDTEHFFALARLIAGQTVSDLGKAARALKRLAPGRRVGLGPAGEETAEDPAERTDAAIDVREALSGLGVDEQSVAEARMGEGRTREATADALGFSEAEVRTRAGRARTRLSAWLRDYSKG